MLNDAIDSFGAIGLRLNIAKIKWVANKHVGLIGTEMLQIGTVLIPVSTELIALGCVVSPNGDEGPAMRHRTVKAWGVFHKWSHILLCRAPISTRTKFWARVVLPSMTWGGQTLRHPTVKNLRAIGFAQKLMIRKMLKSGRRPNGGTIESWLEWHKRTLASAKDVAIKNGVWIETVLWETRLSWAGHIARMGTEGKPPHLLKYLLGWRPLAWWRCQQVYNLMECDSLFHPFGWGRPRRWEGRLPDDWWISLR